LSAVIVVFLVWFGIVVVAAAAGIWAADRWVAPPGWVRTGRQKYLTAVDRVMPVIGRTFTSATIFLALWAFVIIVGLLMGIVAHRLQSVIDEPAFHWWHSHHLQGTWSTVWWKLTDAGAPRVTQALAGAGAVVFAVLYRDRRLWWAPSVVMVLGYAAEKYSQMILKTVIDRGHPPTSHGTWPSGGMGRLIDVYGLIIFFVILRFRPTSPRAWAAGAGLLALCASVQAFARINNLEHWVTDVAGGAIYGTMLLAAMIIGYFALSREPALRPAEPVETAEPATV
jgi:hypothetical protein